MISPEHQFDFNGPPELRELAYSAYLGSPYLRSCAVVMFTVKNAGGPLPWWSVAFFKGEPLRRACMGSADHAKLPLDEQLERLMAPLRDLEKLPLSVVERQLWGYDIPT